MLIDKNMLADHVDEFLRCLKPGQGIHVDSIVNAAFNESSNPHPSFANMPKHTLTLGLGETWHDKRLFAIVRKAVKEILASHKSVTDMCPKPPAGFWVK